MRQPGWMGVAGGMSGRGMIRARRRARLEMEPLEHRALLSTITEYPTVSANAGPNGVTVGLDGNIYFSEFNKGAIGALNTSTGAVSEVSIPGTIPGPYSITTGSTGTIYFTEPTNSVIGIYHPTTATFSSVTTPTANAGPRFITLGSDGNIYFTEPGANKIGMLDTSTNTITEYPVPTANASPYGITSGPDGNIYFTEDSGDKIGELNLTTHAITETAVPTASAAPYSIATGPDGNLWFTEFNGNQIGELNLTTHVITEYPAGPSGTTPTEITAGPDGLLYFTELNNDGIGTINPTSHAIASLPIPTTGSQSLAIVTAPNGNLYFAESATSKIGQIALSTNLVFTTEPTATVMAGTFITVTVKDEYATGVVNESYSGNVSIALSSDPAGGTLTGTLTEAANLGQAVFPDLLVAKAGAGYALGASAAGFSSIVSTGFTVVPGAASQLVVVAQPPASMMAGSNFGVAAVIEDSSGNVVTSYTGDVILGFAVNPTGATLSGTTTVAASGGVAQFPGLSIATGGTGFVLQTAAAGLTAGLTSPFTVTPPTPPPPPPSAPTVIGEQLLFTRRFNKKGRPIGKPIFVGYGLTYSTAMYGPSVASPGNYQLDAIQIRRFRHRIIRILHPLPFGINYVTATNTVDILVRGKPPFPKGGQITIMAGAPTGVESTAGLFLNSGVNGVFQIGPHSRYIN